MKTIKRFHFTPIWRIDQTEQWLHEMELSGYRIEKVSFFRLLYHFKQAKPKSSRYVFLYYSIRGQHMGLVGYGLKQRYNANEIKISSVFLSLLRITIPCDLTFELETRPIYFRMLTLVYLLLTLSVSIGSNLFLYALSCHWGMAVLTILSGIFVLYYLYGVLYTTAQIRKINQTLKK